MKFGIVALLFLTGCGGAVNSPEFLSFTKSHKELTNETIPAVIKTIEGELASTPNLSPEDRTAVEDLINRLKLITRQSDLIYEYVLSDADQKLLAEFVRNSWNKGKSR